MRYKSALKLEKLIVKKISFVRHRDVLSDSQIDVDFPYNVEINGNEIAVELSSILQNTSFILEISMEGKFTVHEDEQGFTSEALKPNVLAIMFPFLRSQVTLITAQPGFESLTLPAININELVSSEKAKSTSDK